MSDAEWDADDFEPPSFKANPKTDKWVGEDEEDEVKENWDDEDEEEDQSDVKPADMVAIQAKKKKSLKERIAEKEEARRKEIEEKLEKKRIEEEQKTPQQQMEEKLRLQKIQEESDLAIALETMGVDKTEKKTKKAGKIESLEPKTEEEFKHLSELLSAKLLAFKESPFYVTFLENVFRDLVLGIEAEDIKKLSSSLTTLYNEKLKLSKASKKKKSKKATLKMDQALDVADYDDFNDYDDYM